jgi:hypothetical protein
MRNSLIAAVLVAVTVPLVAQETGKGVLGQVGAPGQEVKRAPVPTGPAPRLLDGTIDLNGLWVGGGPVAPYPFRFVQNYTHRSAYSRPWTVTFMARLQAPAMS